MLPTLLLTLAALQDAGQESWSSAWTDNLRWAVDESARAVFDRNGDVATFVFLGLDLHKVVSTEDRDLATLTLQPYLTRVDDLDPHPPLFDGPDDWELVWRIFNANVKLRQDGGLNVRVGHFELPFGLEHTVDTNGTLRDYLHGANFGMKADWGATLNGDLDAVDYELAWSRGSGNEYRDEGDPGVVSGRVGSDADGARQWGVSFLDGEFRTPGGIVERERVGLDGKWFTRNLGFFGEVSGGQDGDDTDVLRFLGEVNRRNSDETVLGWLQLVATELDTDGGDADSLESRLGVRWNAARGTTLSAQYVQILDPLDDDAHRAGTVALQLRYRF